LDSTQAGAHLLQSFPGSSPDGWRGSKERQHSDTRPGKVGAHPGVTSRPPGKTAPAPPVTAWGKSMQIRIDDLTGPEIADFLSEHIADMKSVSPPESKHALDLEGLKAADITFWSAWYGDALVGCGALKALDGSHAEIKSMRVAKTQRGRGYGAKLLRHIVDEARAAGYSRLSLETGSMAFFTPARKLYHRFGFVECPPFSGYEEDPNSVFMSLDLAGGE
jgi:putative acetyltransferase